MDYFTPQRVLALNKAKVLLVSKKRQIKKNLKKYKTGVIRSVNHLRIIQDYYYLTNRQYYLTQTIKYQNFFFLLDHEDEHEHEHDDDGNEHEDEHEHDHDHEHEDSPICRNEVKEMIARMEATYEMYTTEVVSFH